MIGHRRIAIIGGGIAGLSAGFDLAGTEHDVHVFEAGDRLGGKIAYARIGDLDVPTAPDAFLARRPEMSTLVRELGLGDSLVSPAAGEARLYRNGRLHPLPPSVLGIPADLESLAENGLISSKGIARAEEDLSRGDDRPEGDESVGDLVRRRLGDEILEYVVDPLLGGINAGDSDMLSITAGVPQIGELRNQHRSLLTAAKSMRERAADPDAPVFFSVAGGLDRVIGALSERLTSARNVSVHLNTPIGSLAPAATGGWEVAGQVFDDVIVATPSYVTHDLLPDEAATAKSLLRGIDYSSVAMIVIVLAERQLDLDPAVSGVLVPRMAGLHVTAVSVATNKWPELAPSGQEVLRVSVGRRHDTRWTELGDDALVATVLDDLRTILGHEISADETLVTRWMRSLPQYDVGHMEHIETLVQSIATEAPGLILAGAALHGLGLPACVASGRSAAMAVLDARV